jgi:hypothetical protein
MRVSLRVDPDFSDRKRHREKGRRGERERDREVVACASYYYA